MPLISCFMSCMLSASQSTTLTPWIMIREPGYTVTVSPAHMITLAALAAIPSTTTFTAPLRAFSALWIAIPV